MNTVCRLEQLFSLDMLAEHLAGFQTPQAEHDPAGDWQHVYRFYSLAGIGDFGGRHGTVRIERARCGTGRFAMHVECERKTPGQFATRLRADIIARDERLPTPLQWSWQSEIVNSEGKVLPDSHLERSAALKDGLVEIAGRKQKSAVREPAVINWLLFDAVGRLPQEQFSPLRFTLVDHFDQIKLGHTLKYVRSATVLLGQIRPRHLKSDDANGNWQPAPSEQSEGRPVRLHVYHHFGEGILPWVYWVDDRGRPLIVVSGIEAYVIDSFAKLAP